MNMGTGMRRREFIGLVGGTAFLWPLIAHAQQSETVRRIGFLMAQAEDDTEATNREAALREGLRKLGWIDGRNIQIVVKHAGGSEQRLQALAVELVKSQPDVLVASATAALVALQKATSTIPIVFAQVTDPVGAGFVKSLAQPGGNITGFTQHEFSIGVKWLELLKELAPHTDRATIIFDPDNPASAGYLSELKSSAPSFRVRLSEQGVSNSTDVDRAIGVATVEPNTGLIVLPGPGPSVRRKQIIALAARYRLPAVYAFHYWVTAGGLACYGIDNIDLQRRASAYVDRILKGEKAADLPIQNATKFQLVINLKTAKALGLEPPITLLARTDEVIE
jgi:putative ABC transport system substrate-binding protein